MLCPIFVADNLKTLYEINTELRGKYFQAAPEECSFTYIPCLNESPALIRVLANVVRAACE